MEDQSIESKVSELFIIEDKNDESIEANKPMVEIMQIRKENLEEKNLFTR